MPGNNSSAEGLKMENYPVADAPYPADMEDNSEVSGRRPDLELQVYV